MRPTTQHRETFVGHWVIKLIYSSLDPIFFHSLRYDMASMKNTLVGICVISMFALSACSTAPSPGATATPALSPTAAPDPSPTPSAIPLPAFEITGLNLLPGKQPGDWRVVGLIENRSSEKLIEAHVAISLLDRSGTILSEAIVPITFKHLEPNETSPFRADFLGIGLASDAAAELSSFATGEFERLRLQANVLSTASTDRGGLAILTEISNSGETPASIAALGLLAQDGLGRAVGLAIPTAGSSVLMGGETAVVLAMLEIDAGAPAYTIYIDAVAADVLPGNQPVSVDGSPKLVVDGQGNPFVVGMLINNSEQPYSASMSLTLAYQGELISMAQIDTPVPLGPGERRPFSATEFPGMGVRLREIEWTGDDLQIEARIDPLIVGPQAAPYSPLDLSIQSFERIGSFAFIPGIVTNPYANPVQGASVMASLYDSRGRLVTAGWITISEILSAGEGQDFVLPIPMPANANPRVSEFDVWAAGVQVSSSSNDSD